MIVLDNVSFTPAGSGRPILCDISLSIGRGERVGIVGPSGSGKTTLGYHLCGAHRLALAGSTTGRLLLDGRDALNGGPAGFAGLVGQNPEAQLFCRTVLEEVLLGPRLRSRNGNSPAEAGKWLKHCKARFDPEAVVSELSLGQKQLTAILSMLAIEPKVLLLDEPTSYLDAATADWLFTHLDTLSRTQGWVVLIIEHDLKRLSGFVDRYLTLADGQLVSDGPFQPPRPGRKHRGINPPYAAYPGKRIGEAVLELDQVDFSYGQGKKALASVSFSVAPGEIVALMGHNGCGKSTLMRLVKGLAKPETGSVRLSGGKSPMREVGLMMQNPEEQIFAHSVEAECGYWLANLGLPSSEREVKVRNILASLGLGEKMERAPFTLSFGEKRRLCLASILVGDPAVLCLDEPTTGLDDDNMEVMAGKLREQAALGKAVLVATHEDGFADMVATRIIRMESGRIVSDMPITVGLQ